ncbi:MAG TPA: hypothetical protein VFY10_07490 [Dehalococcoidia bacterium]|nr:hypothetical protein [Dehalococcoidia bacterium]
MKRVLVLVVVLTLVGGGIAFAISGTNDSPSIVHARIEGQTDVVGQTTVLMANEPATPTETPSPEITIEATTEPPPQATPQTFAADSSSSSNQIPLQPASTPPPATAEADQVSQDALVALKQLLASPQSHDTDALVGAVKALDSAIIQIQALHLPLEQQQGELAALLLARAHLLELLTQVATQSSAPRLETTPTSHSTSNERSPALFIGGPRNQEKAPNAIRDLNRGGIVHGPSQP